MRESIPAESQHVRHLVTFTKRRMFPSLSDEVASKIARAAIAATQASHRPISQAVRQNILEGRRLHSCFLCGDELDVDAPQKSPKHLTLEHLWPSSMGGDSVEENLLPACVECQKTTKDTLSWEWANVHNLVLPPEPSADALRSVTKRFKYAKHYFDALTLGSRHHSLKEAFLQMGPVRDPIGHTSTGMPVTFFDLRTT